MNMTRQSEAAARIGCLFILGLPFAVAGVLFICQAIGPLVEAWQMAAWEPVPMTIVSTELDAHKEDSGTTYRVLAEYTYTYNGRPYIGWRIGIHGGRDNFGHYHRRLYEELEHHRVTGTSYTGYVNPANPAEAVLSRNVRPMRIASMDLLGILLSSIGFCLIAGALFGQEPTAGADVLRAASPERPWLWREDWKAGVLTSSNKKSLRTSIVFALLLNMIGWPIGLSFLQSGEVPVFVTFIWALVPILGVFLTGLAIRSAIRWFKYGESRFLPTSLPAVPGGTLSGRIEVPAYIHVDGAFAVRLKCVNRTAMGTGKQRSMAHETLWEQEVLMPANLADFRQNRVTFPVEFTLPENVQESRSEPNNEILWKLKVIASVSGVDYAAEFEVPVFRTDEVSVFSRE